MLENSYPWKNKLVCRAEDKFYKTSITYYYLIEFSNVEKQFVNIVIEIHSKYPDPTFINSKVSIPAFENEIEHWWMHIGMASKPTSIYNTHIYFFFFFVFYRNSYFLSIFRCHLLMMLFFDIETYNECRTVHADSPLWTILAIKMQKWFPNSFESLCLHIFSNLMEL